jgi:6-phosphogluconolactonase
MSKATVRVFKTLEDLSWAVAERFEEFARTHSIMKNAFSVALSGGSTPRHLYQTLGSEAFAGRIRWDKVHVFQVDERCVPADDAQSNFRMIRETLLNHIAIPDSNVHRLAAEQEDRDAACRQYAAELARVLRPEEDQFPSLDLALLGMGPDGHTASLFPGSEALEERSLWVRPNFVEKLKAHRLTLTLPILNAAVAVLFMVAGAGKAETLRQVLEGPAGKFPAQRVQPVKGTLTWFVDEAAAQLLSPATRGES